MAIHLVQVSCEYQMLPPSIPKQQLAPLPTQSKYFQKKILIFVKTIFSSEKNPGQYRGSFQY